VGNGWRGATGEACGLSFVPDGLVGEHRHGGCGASADAAGAGNEWRRAAGWVWRTAADAGDAATRVQEREIHYTHHRHGQREAIWQGAGVVGARGWLCVVCGDLTNIDSPGKRSKKDLPQSHRDTELRKSKQ